MRNRFFVVYCLAIIVLFIQSVVGETAFIMTSNSPRRRQPYKNSVATTRSLLVSGPSFRCSYMPSCCRSRNLCWATANKQDGSIDVEFTKLDGSEQKRPKSLLQAFVEMDPEWSELSVSFVERTKGSSSTNERFIDCKMAFIMEMDDVKYAIGTPVDTQVALYSDTTGTFLDPDLEEHMELLELAASTLEKELDPDIKIKQTPRVLTVEGTKLESMTNAWKELAMTRNLELERQMLRDDDHTGSDLEYLDTFFGKELGDNYRQDILKDDGSLLEEDIVKLFDIPGMGTRQDDKESMNDLMTPESIDSEKLDGVDEEDAMALRLVSFTGPDNNIYSLVQMLQPLVLVAKEDPSVEPFKRLLLTTEEAEYIVPKLELEFRKELEAAGLLLHE